MKKKDDIRGAKRILDKLGKLATEGSKKREGEKDPPQSAALILLDNVDNPEIIKPEETNIISGKDWLKVLITTRKGHRRFWFG